jgi:hypothetical protein
MLIVNKKALSKVARAEKVSSSFMLAYYAQDITILALCN